MILMTEGRTDAQASEAEKVMHLLNTAYPGHPWAVRVDHGIIFIRHLEFGSNYGMNLKTSEYDYDTAVMNKKIIMLAGEWLERAGLRRGRWEEHADYRVEGVPERFQPISAESQEKFKKVIADKPKQEDEADGLAETSTRGV